MPKQARIKPIFDDNADLWRVSIPAKLSETGKRQNRYFDRKSDSIDFATLMREKQEQFGSIGRSLSPHQVAEAAEAYRVLAPTGSSLMSVVREHVAQWEARNAACTVAELFEKFLATKGDDYRAGQGIAMRSTIRKFNQELNVADLDVAAITAAFEGLTGNGLEAAMRRLGTVLRFAVKVGLMTKNPLDKMIKPKVVKGDIEVYTPAQVEAFLNEALTHDVEVLPALMFGCFTGVRPNGELFGIDWSDVLPNTMVFRSTKTERKREIELNPNMQAWINRYLEVSGAKREGKVMGNLSYKDFQNRRARIFKSLKLRWIHDGMRHTFASYRLEQTNNLTTITRELGHYGETGTLWDHYHAHVTAEDTARFWSIMPPTPAENVLPFAAVA